MKYDIDSFQRIQLAIAEWIDAWRIFPRMMVMMYMYLVYKVVDWYMSLTDTIIGDCAIIPNCVMEAPSNQHAMLVTAIIGFAAAIFGFYTSTSKPNKVPEKKDNIMDDHY